MKLNSLVSIILCTRNRCGPLQRVLEALGRMDLRPEWETELFLVDNGCGDQLATVLRESTLRRMQVRYRHEAREGKGYALNTGLAGARGDIMLFLDDDTIPERDWAQQMVSALLNGDCDAVTGQITLASNLNRPWLTTAHRWWLASSHDAQPRRGSRELIGANMAFRRSVLDRVGPFDPELGPGALGLGEDTLLGWQLVEAGFKIGYAAKARVTHQPDASRLTRISWLSEASKHGRSEAYLRYHWEHADIRFPWLGQFYYVVKLQVRRLFQRPCPIEAEGCPLWEMSYVLHVEMCKQFRLERGRPRNYARYGLTKRVQERSNGRNVGTRSTEAEGEAIHRVSGKTS